MCSSNACVQRTRTMSTAVRDRERARVAAGAAYDSSHARVNRRVMWAALIALPGVTVQATHTTRLALHSTLFIPHCVSDLELAQPSTAVCARCA